MFFVVLGSPILQLGEVALGLCCFYTGLHYFVRCFYLQTPTPQNPFFVMLSEKQKTERLTTDGAAVVCACQGFATHPLL